MTVARDVLEQICRGFGAGEIPAIRDIASADKNRQRRPMPECAPRSSRGSSIVRSARRRQNQSLKTTIAFFILRASLLPDRRMHNLY